jgi:hypothetical protein
VSCASATDCLAVGQNSDGLATAQFWNGRIWTLLSPINP